MNSLSWMIYFAGMTEGVRTLCFILASLTAMIGGGAVMFVGMEEGSMDRAWPWLKRTALIATPLALLGIAMPTSTTVYAIAASEMGESALNTETGGKAVKALNAWLDRQIDGEAE